MTKKLSIFLLALFASAGITQAAIVDGSCGDNLTWSLNTKDSTLTITGSGEMTNWSGDPYFGYPYAPWYDYRSYIKYVSLPDGLTSIGSFAFSECIGLTSVTIPNSITSIGEGAFYRCSGLTSVTIPNSVTRIGNSAFWCCSGLTSVTIPNSVTSIGRYTFEYCTGLTSVTIPNSVTSIGDEAFGGVPNINYSGSATGSPWGAKSVNGYVDGYLVYIDNTKTTLLACSSAAQGEIIIPNSVTSIGDYAFGWCTSLTSVTIPNSVTSIGENAFYRCTGLTSVTIGNSVTSIGSSAFRDCIGLTSVTIGNSVTSIGNYAFRDCSGLTSVTIPNSVTSIGNYAFCECSGLTSVTIGNSVTSIGESAFSYGNRLETIILGKNIKSIGAKAFANCPYILNVYAQMEYPPIIDASVFTGCGDLSMIDLFVSESAIKRYQKTDVWKEFNLQAGEAPKPVYNEYTITYLDKNHESIESENIKLNVPVAPVITGFTFVRWQAYADDIKDGITIQAVYEADEPSSAPAVYTNPANPAQKLIRNGSVYILTDDSHTYTLTGQQVK